MVTSVRPNFFIVGGPKCGTNTLYRYLRQHPDVFMPLRKEPHYFCPDLPSPRYVQDETSYLELFRPGVGCRRVGEASVYYLYSKEAAWRIKAFAPNAAIIIMLRNPVDMIYSLHSQRLYSGHENLTDFAEALAAEGDRRLGHRLPARPHPIPVLQYRHVGKYAEQVRRYIEVFGRERIQVVLFDDLTRDSGAIARRTCEFLGIDAAAGPGIVPENPSKRVRSRTLRDLMKFSPVVSRLAHRLLSQEMRRRLGGRLVRWNTQYVPRPPLPSKLRTEIQGEFAADVEKLSALIGRDLCHWCASSGPRPNQEAVATYCASTEAS